MSVFCSQRFLPALFGIAVLATGCTFEPPGSVLDNDDRQTSGPDGGTSPGDVDGGGIGGGGTESVTLTYTSQPIGGSVYAPKNVVVAWLENAGGTYIATLNRQSLTRTKNLVAWLAKAGGNDTDAVTGATRANHNAPVTATWSIPADLPNGTYTIRIETADGNSVTPDQNNQGSFTFDKNGTASKQEGLTAAGYSNVSIDYVVN